MKSEWSFVVVVVVVVLWLIFLNFFLKVVNYGFLKKKQFC